MPVWRGGQAVECGGMGSSGTPVTIYFAQSYSRLRVWARVARVGVRGAQGYQYGECRIDTELWSALSTPPRALQPLVQPESENSPTDRPPASRPHRCCVAATFRTALIVPRIQKYEVRQFRNDNIRVRPRTATSVQLGYYSPPSGLFTATPERRLSRNDC